MDKTYLSRLAGTIFLAGCLQAWGFPSASGDFEKSPLLQDDYLKGKVVFFRLLGEMARTESLVEKDRKTLLNPERRLSGLYEHMMNFYALVRGEESDTFSVLGGRMAEEFIASLQEFPAEDSRTRLESLLISLGYHSQKNYPKLQKFFRPMTRRANAGWAIKELRMKEAHGLARGKGVKVAIIDSGVDPSIKEIRGRISAYKDFLNGPLPIWEKGRFPCDWGGHGTSIATVAYRVAPEADYLIVKVTDFETMRNVPASRWTAYLFAAGILWAAEEGAEVINLSAAFLDDPNGVIGKAVRRCWSKNIVVVAAMRNGWDNESRTRVSIPAAYPETIAVGGAEDDRGVLRLWPSSSRGNCLDVVAPAAGIWVDFPVYLVRRNSGRVVFGRGGIVPAATSEGNSLAAPVVAGAAALVLSAMEGDVVSALRKEPGRLAQAVKDIITGSASNERLGFAFPNPFSGFGFLDCRRAVELAAAFKLKSDR